MWCKIKMTFLNHSSFFLRYRTIDHSTCSDLHFALIGPYRYFKYSSLQTTRSTSTNSLTSLIHDHVCDYLAFRESIGRNYLHMHKTHISATNPNMDKERRCNVSRQFFVDKIVDRYEDVIHIHRIHESHNRIIICLDLGLYLDLALFPSLLF